MRSSPAIIAALLASLAGVAQAQALRSYTNARFGTTAAAPADWKMQPPPENDDGRVFVSPDGAASITISGILMTSSVSEEIAERSQPGADETIAYKAASPNTIVVSGYRGDLIFYRKTLFGCGVANDLSIEYPARDKARYNGLVARVAASLRSGRGAMSTGC